MTGPQLIGDELGGPQAEGVGWPGWRRGAAVVYLRALAAARMAMLAENRRLLRAC